MPRPAAVPPDEHPVGDASGPHRWKSTVPDGVPAEPLTVTRSVTDTPVVTVGLLPPGLTWVTIVGGTRTADAFSERSWLPIEVVSIWMIRWWYGEPLMFIALVPTPQFCWVAIWPPQASTRSPPAVVVNVTCTVTD